MKKIITLALTLCMTLCLAACSVSSTSTTTTTTTDADGNVTTETVTTSTYPAGSCGEAAEDGEEHQVPVTIKNETGADIVGLYIVGTGADSWSDLLPEGTVIADGETFDQTITFTYTTEECSFDLGIKGVDDEDPVEYEPINVLNLSAEGFTITFTADGWTAE